MSEQGRRLAAVLAGSWRPAQRSGNPDTRSWDATVACLVQTGAGGLGWWRVRNSALRDLPASQDLHEAYRRYSIEVSVHELLTSQAVERCRAAGVEPLLSKGWTLCRLYPEPGLRPCGDIDLYVRPEQHAAAEAALADFRPRLTTVDLHRGTPDLDRPLDELFAHSALRPCGATRVRTASPEDELRHVCVHLMRHGAWRPLWVCDVAVALESAGERFDWDYCLRGNPQRTQAVICAVGLAQHLLGARVAHAPLAERARRLPAWLVPAVLRQWGRRHELHPLMVTALRHPTEVLPALRRRWPNPVESTMFLHMPFNEAPRLPLQVTECLVRLAWFLIRLPREWRREHAAARELLRG